MFDIYPLIIVGCLNLFEKQNASEIVNAYGTPGIYLYDVHPYFHPVSASILQLHDVVPITNHIIGRNESHDSFQPIARFIYLKFGTRILRVERPY